MNIYVRVMRFHPIMRYIVGAVITRSNIIWYIAVIQTLSKSEFVQKVPHILPSSASIEVYIVIIVGKINRTITAPYSTLHISR